MNTPRSFLGYFSLRSSLLNLLVNKETIQRMSKISNHFRSFHARFSYCFVSRILESGPLCT